MSVITDWTADKAAGFGRQALAFQHNLASRPMFSDEGLISVLERYPRERLGVFTMGSDLTDTASWRRGAAPDMSGRELFEAVMAGRLWLNLRDTDKHLPEFADLCDEIVDEKQARTGVKILKPDMGLLISSPNAQVFYHLDVPLSSLWQIRGHKTFRLYPREAPYVSDAEIERFVTREAEGQFDFDPSWDDGAATYEMTPGVMVTWPQNAPHRVTNGPMVNVSLSMEFMTPPAVLRANIMYANSILRRRFGLSPKVQERLGPTALAKVALAAAVKSQRLRQKKVYTPILKPSFSLDTAQG
ncbi:MAG: hypothetical protein ACYDD1_01020 [Caulobacteraceae bacterium]